MHRVLCAVLALAVAFSGCGTILRGTDQEIPIRCNVRNVPVHVRANGMTIELDRTGVAKVPRERDVVIVAEAEGYRQGSKTLHRTFSVPFAIVDILVAGVVGLVGDILLGGIFSFEPGEVAFVLEPLAPAQARDEVDSRPSPPHAAPAPSREVTASAPAEQPAPRPQPTPAPAPSDTPAKISRGPVLQGPNGPVEGTPMPYLAPSPAPSPGAAPRFCQSCGARFPDDAAFCPGCGRKR